MTADDPFVTTKDRPGSYDAIATAKPGEPLFPLQGGDPFAPATILHWASLVRDAAHKEPDRKKAEAMLRKATDAEFAAWSFQAYFRGEAEAASEGDRSTYSGVTIDVDEGRTQREAMIRGAMKLHSILADALVIAETLAKYRIHPEEEVRIRDAVAGLRQAAVTIEPRRGRAQS